MHPVCTAIVRIVCIVSLSYSYFQLTFSLSCIFHYSVLSIYGEKKQFLTNHTQQKQDRQTCWQSQVLITDTSDGKSLLWMSKTFWINTLQLFTLMKTCESMSSVLGCSGDQSVYTVKYSPGR